MVQRSSKGRRSFLTTCMIPQQRKGKEKKKGGAIKYCRQRGGRESGFPVRKDLKQERNGEVKQADW